MKQNKKSELILKRTNKEILLIVLSVIAAVTISAFSILRFSQSEWLIGAFDLIVGLGMVLITFYVYTTQKVLFPSIVLAIFSCVSAVTTVYIKGVANIYWAYPAFVAAFYLLPPKSAISLSVITLTLLSPELYKSLPTVAFLSALTTMLMTCLFGFFFSKSVVEQHAILAEMATKDSLTGVGNRRALDQKLLEIEANQNRKYAVMSLILLDLDHFKLINDDFGHLVGDQILIRVAEIIQGRIRVTDALYRFGGEEFIIVPLSLDLKSASRLAEQLRVLVENYDLVAERPVTISLGVAEYVQGESCESWLQRADNALYEAKKDGRNNVCEAKIDS